jgi:hypothetical protein
VKLLILGKKTIEIETVEEQIKISSESFKSTVLGMNASDFPNVPSEASIENSLKISSKEFANKISSVLFMFQMMKQDQY